MSNIASSFASLVKYNNGFFKSEAQAKFLLSQCIENVFTVSGSVYNNGFILSYICDNIGIIQIDKYTCKHSKTETTWKRESTEAFQVKADNRQARKDLVVKINKVRKLITRSNCLENNQWLMHLSKNMELAQIMLLKRNAQNVQLKEYFDRLNKEFDAVC